MNQQLAPLLQFFAVEPNPIPLKALLTRMGLGTGLRLPLLPIASQQARQADRIAELCVRLDAEQCGPIAA